MKSWLVFFASLAFGALFLWSGILKIKDPISFADAIRNFRLVGDPITPALAHFLPWLEVFAGLAVMIDRTR
ncbi:MAG: DoxX family membrane protein, partial [Verrucomicrobiae bacterium]|nr:DoxX family membrane protein [Verrucomicrobiae bacterium]